MHHKNPSRDGVYTEPALTKAAAAGLTKDTTFVGTLSNTDQVYAQPLFVDGGPGGTDLVIVVSETNNVYALNGANGSVVWMKNLGTPVPLSMMPCGNIDPYGITGTPVIDLATRTLYLDAMVTPDGGTTKQHHVFALSIDDGTTKTGWPVDMGTKAVSGTTTFNAAPQSQRSALAFLNGTLYVSFGGLYGDCGTYHGWLVAISTTNPTQVQAWATAAHGGGSWGMGGVASDGTNVYIATGNTMQTNTWGGGEGVLRFTPGASFGTPASWAPTNWLSLDNGDADVGGSGPIIFDVPAATPSHFALALGKDGNAYLLDRTNLGGVSNALATMHASSSEIINAGAVYTTATATYVAFRGNGTACTVGGPGSLVTLKVQPAAPPTFAASWCANGGGGSPMVTTTDGHANAIVWDLGVGTDQLLHGFDGDTGATIFNGGGVTIPGMRQYNTPIAAKGRIFVPSDHAVVAFKP
jgi:hypothetical protein